MISIIIPFKDKSELLRQCVSSILEKTDYKKYELLLVDNQSAEKKTSDFLNELAGNERIEILQYKKPFNFSAINNFAVKHAKGEFVLLLNNDTQVISSDWLGEMLKCFNGENVGVVGAKLLYSNGTIQHCGVMLEEKRMAIHAFRTWKEEDVKVGDVKEWNAVTGACLMTKKELFLELGGLDEDNLPIAYNDIDYCLKVRELGFKVVCVSSVKLYHYESVSRKSDILARFFNRKRYNRFIEEREYIKRKWKEKIRKDSFYETSFI